MHIVYYSNVTKNTERFVAKLGLPATRIEAGVPEPSIAIIPTYGDAAVPVVVLKALKDKADRDNIVAIIGAGNMNFGRNYCAGARKLATKLGVPVIYEFELQGTPEDVREALAAIDTFTTELAKETA
ncbi:class Ib ribonucleoside-diphosphate reductase assembly flavoprotein NrdI [Aeromicrobium sp. 179-A 4D2 NHS]|uniref:class Ib ribonucleoside-diphosphate reductase assembly flavoprotein NrdI n=1 Tax=Aeromicrobium sp. 179-A 4D2 NHS TaxID=3142375 RepID=UPI0039A3CCD9